jgi:lantibiotic modifying enzyme
LGSTVNQDGGTDQDINQRIKKANAGFIQLYQVWKNKILSKKTKLRICNTIVKSVLLCACETWSVLKTSTNKLQSFVNRILRRILNIRWPNKISNNSLWEITKQVPIDIQIKKRKWRWIWHTLRKPAGDIEKDVLD